LGLFVNDDTNPSPADVDRTEGRAFKRFGPQNYEFYRYDQAGHAFCAWYRANYRHHIMGGAGVIG